MDNKTFLDAITANPSDLALRRVYADWLEEQGECEKAVMHRWLAEEDIVPTEIPPNSLLLDRDFCEIRLPYRPKWILYPPKNFAEWHWPIMVNNPVIALERYWEHYGPKEVTDDNCPR
jgi:uncharacterized protein (TIGR02996 family)